MEIKLMSSFQMSVMYSLGTGEGPREELMSLTKVWRWCCAPFWLAKSVSRADLSNDIFSQEVNQRAFATVLGATRKLVADNAWVMKSNTFATQDVDAAFMGKSDLQSKVDTLYGEINFLKYLFDTVSAALRSPFSFPTSCKGVNWRRCISTSLLPQLGHSLNFNGSCGDGRDVGGAVSILRSVRVR